MVAQPHGASKSIAQKDAKNKQPPLWQQLQHTAQVVQAVIGQGQSAPTALEQVPVSLRAGVQALSYAVLRRWGVAQWLRKALVVKAPPIGVDVLLSTALALLWQEDSSVASHAASAPRNGLPYNTFTLVNQTVEAARRHARMRHHSGLINACLRRFLREQELWQTRCQQASPSGIAALLNLPQWWLKRLQADYPADFVQIVQAGQQQPAMHLRVNARHGTAQQYLQQHLLPAGLQGTQHGDYGVWLHTPCVVQRLPEFDKGLVSVQDAAAQLAAPLLLRALQDGQEPKSHAEKNAEKDAKQGAATWRLLDACAAPGGKTAHLLELGEHDVTALEIDAKRSVRITENLQRLQLSAKVCTADAAQPKQWWTGELFDGILLDAPCSASGIVRRHPDIVWLRRESDIEQLVHIQRQLLDTLWPLLRIGGVLLYCTCSVFKAEGEEQIQAFLARHTNAKRLPACGHLLPQTGVAATEALQESDAQQEPYAQLQDHDGFYYALLRREAD